MRKNEKEWERMRKNEKDGEFSCFKNGIEEIIEYKEDKSVVLWIIKIKEHNKIFIFISFWLKSLLYFENNCFFLIYNNF